MKKMIFAFIFLLSGNLCAQEKEGQARIDSLLNEIKSSGTKTFHDTLRTAILADLSFDYYNIDPDKGIEYGREGLLLAERLKLKNEIARINYYLGANYLVRSDYPAALYYSLRALKTNEELGNKGRTASTLRNIGRIFVLQKNTSKALDYYFKALTIYEEQKDSNNISLNLGDIGSAYEVQKKYTEALQYYHRALETNKMLGDKNGIADNTGNIGLVLMDQGNYAKALEYFFSALKLNKDLGDKSSILINFGNIGDCYLFVAKDVRQNKKMNKLMPSGKSTALRKAVDYLSQSVALCKEIGDLDDLQNYAKDLSEAEELLGSYKNALTSYKEYIAAKDSVFSKENDKKIVRLTMEDEYQRKRLTDSLNTWRNEKTASLRLLRQRNNFYLSIAGILVVIAFVGFVIYNSYRRNKLHFQMKVSETEMTALRAQMNPHFIFNALNSIHTYILDNNNKIASSYLLKFSALTRIILENSQHQFVHLADELRAMELYLSLEELRLGDRLDYEITTESDIDKENTLVPPLMLQPFIENAILHGLQSKESGGIIKINIRKDREMIRCTITDNGVGFTKTGEEKVRSHLNKKESLGMKLTEQRIAIINRMKKTNAYVEITNLADTGESSGVKVELVLPLELRF